MSPSREALVVGFSPEALQVVRTTSSVLRTRVLERHVFAVEADAGAGWEAPLAALQNVLSSSRPKRRRCRIVLSNRFVRYALVDWHDALSSSEARLRLAQAQFRALYGAAAGAWSVHLAHGGYGAPALACAADSALVTALSATATAAGLELSSVQPHAAVAFNRARRAIRENDFWFAAVEAGRLWLGRGSGAGWSAVATRRRPTECARALVAAIEQELAVYAHDAASPKVYFSGAGLSAETVDILQSAGYVAVALSTEGPLALGGADVVH